MNKLQKSNQNQPDGNQEQTTSHNFVLRIWKTDNNIFKGYILDPITNSTYPLVDMSEVSKLDGSKPIVFQGTLIDTLGCWIGLLI